jgi:hypothetical protein
LQAVSHLSNHLGGLLPSSLWPKAGLWPRELGPIHHPVFGFDPAVFFTACAVEAANRQSALDSASHLSGFPVRSFACG